MVPFSATRPVNPPGASPVLTADQVWRGLAHKARNPREFVPQITACRVTQDEEDKVVRIVRFGDGPEMREEVHFYPPTIAYFEMTPANPPPSSSASSTPPPPVRITNLLSYGPPPAHGLLLSFSFAPRLPHFSAEEAAALSPEELNARVGKGVEGTIEVVRGMVRDGKL